MEIHSQVEINRSLVVVAALTFSASLSALAIRLANRRNTGVCENALEASLEYVL